MRDYGLSEEELVEKYGLLVFYDDWSMYMPDKTQEQILLEIYHVVVGIPENPYDNGIVGDITEMKNLFKDLNGQVAKNTMFRKIGTWITGALVLAILSLLVTLFTGKI